MSILAGHGTVDIGIEYNNIVALCIVLAYAQLSLDGLLGLLIAGIPGIDHCCFQNSFFLLFSFASFFSVLSFGFRREPQKNENDGAVKEKEKQLRVTSLFPYFQQLFFP